MKKPLLLILLFFSFHSLADHIQIKVPLIMEGVQEDKAHLSGEYYIYNLEGSFSSYYSKKKAHEVNTTPQEFLESLFLAYESKNKKAFFKLMTNTARKKVKALPSSEFDKEWNTLSSIKRPKVFYFYRYKNGYLISWGKDGIKQSRILFIRKEANTFKMDKLHFSKNEIAFQNIGLYFTLRPKDPVMPTILNKFNLQDEKYDLSFKTTDELEWIHIFKYEDGKWVPKVSVQDNVTGKYKFDDSDEMNNRIKVHFKKSHFTHGKAHKLLILNTNFRVQSFPQELYPNENLLIK